MRKLILEEILWEITSKCNENCAYCGSKDIKDLPQLSEMSLKAFAEQINSIKSIKKVTLTGGEPTLLGEDILAKVIEIIKPGRTVSIVTKHPEVVAKMPSVLRQLDAVGFSVNTENDLKTAKEQCAGIPQEKLVIITNFGRHNIFEFDKIVEFIQSFPNEALVSSWVDYAVSSQTSVYTVGPSSLPGWQIQLTIGKEFELPVSGIEFLWSKVKTLPGPVRYILADVAQKCHECSAGLHTCSITYDGLIVPCLSGRSWMTKEEFNAQAAGSLLESDLASIWKNDKWKNRFEECKCCRDCFEYPTMEISPTNATEILSKKPVFIYGVTVPKVPDTDWSKWYEKGPNKYPEVAPPTVQMYAVSPLPPYTMGYAVGTLPTDSTWKIATTDTFSVNSDGLPPDGSTK